MTKLSQSQYLELIRNCKRTALYCYFDPVYQGFLNTCPRDEKDIAIATEKASCIIDKMVDIDRKIKHYEKELIILMACDGVP